MCVCVCRGLTLPSLFAEEAYFLSLLHVTAKSYSYASLSLTPPQKHSVSQAHLQLQLFLGSGKAKKRVPLFSSMHGSVQKVFI